MKRSVLLVPGLALAVLAGCKEERPTATRSFFDPQQQQGQQAEQPPAAIPETGELPEGHPPVAGQGGTPVAQGAVTLPPDHAGQVPEGVLYITARLPAPEGQRGQAILVRRVPSPTFPHAFELTTADAMMMGGTVPEAFHLEARLDQDGDAISLTPGDLAGRSAGLVERGARDVTLVLETVVQEARPGAEVQPGMPSPH